MNQKSRVIPDDEATDKLYQQHAASIFMYVRQHTQRREDAEDILVDTFLAALEEPRFKQFSEKEQVSWLWRVARNKTIDTYRRAQIRRSVPLEEITETIFDDEERTPERSVLRLEEEEGVHKLLERLTPSQQEVVHLRFGYGLRCAEIASIVGKREAAVRTMLSRAMNVLRIVAKE